MRKTTNSLIAQIVEYHPEGDKVLVSACATELKKFGWNAHTGNIPAAYLTGVLLGVRAKKKKVTNVVQEIHWSRV